MPAKVFGESAPPTGTVAWFNDDPANIPAGWAFCDGLNGTPDLRGRFMKNVPNSGVNPGATGGQDSYIMNSSQLPSHSHYVPGTTNVGNHTHNFGDGDSRRREGDSRVYYQSNNGNYNAGTSYNGEHSHSLSVSTIGSSSPVGNLPPFVELVPIMKL